MIGGDGSDTLVFTSGKDDPGFRCDRQPRRRRSEWRRVDHLLQRPGEQNAMTQVSDVVIDARSTGNTLTLKDVNIITSTRRTSVLHAGARRCHGGRPSGFETAWQRLSKVAGPRRAQPR
ncbi:MAG: hypothetical protein R3D80_19780 [Paracoccaceae bacterium]